MNDILVINVRIPYSENNAWIIRDDILSFIDKFSNERWDIGEDNRGLFLSVAVYDIHIANVIEAFFDGVRICLQGLRYSIMIYDRSKKHPSSVRINKKGNKIITKKQTKLMGIC